jgi:hypothetical protein
MGTRAMGMGGAFTAVASDISGLYYNPAGLSRLTAHEAAASFITGMSDNSIQHYAYGGPLPFSGISGNGYSSIGTSLLVASGGNVEVNQTNPDGSFAGTSNIKASADTIFTVGYGERVGSTPIDVKNGGSYGINHFVGLSGKIIHSTLVQAYTDTTIATDIGYLVNNPETGLTLGLSALNLGGSLRYRQDDDPLPTTLRAGAALQGNLQNEQSFTASADADYDLHARLWHGEIGGEYLVLRSFAFRMGYQFLRDTVGLTAGIGLRWRARVFIDYAFAYGEGINDSHRFTITYRFGGVSPSTRSQARRPFIQSAPDREREPVETFEQKKPEAEPAPRVRPTPREAPTQGVPGWIY